MAQGHYDTDGGFDPLSDALPENRHVLAGQWCAGGILKSAREAGGESLDDVAEAIRIRAEYLHAIEEENYYGLPGWAHAVGYVRSYALYLGLDPGPLVRRVRDQLALREHVFEMRAVERSHNVSRLLSWTAVAAVACVVVVGLWLAGPVERVTAFLSPLPDRVMSMFDTAPGQAVRVAKADAIQSATVLADAGAVEPAQLRNPALVPLDSAQSNISPPVGPPKGVLVLQPLPRHSIDRGAETFGEVTLRAREPVWFRIENESGSLVAERQMGRGEVHRLPNVRDLIIAARNGGAIEYYIDGNYAGVLGADGMSVSGVSLAGLAVRRIGG